jgi:hypothetical protein
VVSSGPEAGNGQNRCVWSMHAAGRQHTTDFSICCTLQSTHKGTKPGLSPSPKSGLSTSGRQQTHPPQHCQQHWPAHTAQPAAAGKGCTIMEACRMMPCMRVTSWRLLQPRHILPCTRPHTAPRLTVRTSCASTATAWPTRWAEAMPPCMHGLCSTATVVGNHAVPDTTPAIAGSSY